MPENFATLSKEFNKTAADLGAGNGNWQMAVAKYLLIMRHKADTPEQKELLTGTLLGAAIDRLEKVVAELPQMSAFSPSMLESLYGTFRPLAAPENLPFLPPAAAQRMADVTLDLVRVLETYDKHDRVTYENYTNIRKNYTEFSFFMLETAEVVKAAEAQLSGTTQSDITLGKSPHVKSRLGKPS